MLHMLLIYQFRVHFRTLMFILKQFDPQPRFHVGMCRSRVQGLTNLGSISEIVCYVASSNHAKFHAFITKVNNFGR